MHEWQRDLLERVKRKVSAYDLLLKWASKKVMLWFAVISGPKRGLH